MTEKQSTRMFVGIPVEEDRSIRMALDNAEKMVRSILPQAVKFTPEPRSHITLRFLGDVDFERLGDLTVELHLAAKNHVPFILNLNGMGIFDGSNAVWAGIGGDVDALNALQETVDAVVKEQGFPPSGFPFHPHMTVGRVNGAMPEEAVKALRESVRQQEMPSLTFYVPEIALYSSSKTPEGPGYAIFQTMPLRNG